MLHTQPLRQSLIPQKRSRAAFTLVEMLVAAVVGAVLIVLVAQMASTGLQTVGIAGGRMVSASKMHTLRSQLAADLALLPDPALGLVPGMAPLKIETRGKVWTLTLLQSDSGSRSGSAWKQITYRWNPDQQTLERRQRALGDSSMESPAQILVTGLIEWQVSVLTDPAAERGPRTWNSTQALPAALHCQASLSSVHEQAQIQTQSWSQSQGQRSDFIASAEKGREYQWRQVVADGGGSLEP